MTTRFYRPFAPDMAWISGAAVIVVAMLMLQCGSPSDSTSEIGDAGKQATNATTPEEARYVAEILAHRRNRDADFQDNNWSPLAVIAVARLNQVPTVIGSKRDADLFLPDEEVMEEHAEIVLETDTGGNQHWLLRALEGKVWSVLESPKPIEKMRLDSGTRVRIGRFIIYMDRLGTLGAVVRALDFTSASFTNFQGLSYFAPDPTYRVEALVTPYPEIQEVMINDTHGWERPAWRYGEAAFTLNGYRLRLVLLVFQYNPGPQDPFFIAFTDSTKGIETYPAARYLHPKFVASGRMMLDFNLASNPSCAYNTGFACPLPPWENRLPIPIRAGEKIYTQGSVH